jgi:hypothetical protein
MIVVVAEGGGGGGVVGEGGTGWLLEGEREINFPGYANAPTPPSQH